MKPIVSIIVPVFNREKIVIETIQSVQHQTYDAWEMIVVDDGSTDNTLIQLKEAAAVDHRIKVHVRNRMPKGAPTCRNIGIEIATGEFIIFLDSDDILSPNALKNRIEKLNGNSSFNFIVNASAFFTHHPKDASFRWNKLDSRPVLDRFLLQDPVWQTTGPTWRRKYLLEGHFRFDESALSSQDWEFHLKVLLTNPNYHLDDDVPDNFIRRNKSIETISAKHASYEKALNRLNIIMHLMEHQVVQKNIHYSEKLLFTLVLESIRIFNSGNKVPDKFISFIKEKKSIQHTAVTSGVKFLTNGAKLYNLGSFFFRLYRKCMYEKLVNEKVFGSSYYRTPLKDSEMQGIKDSFNNYNRE